MFFQGASQQINATEASIYPLNSQITATTCLTMISTVS
ncbi:hypothetical Protein YC6258_00539 [Gynuella sunshinyii YC6258]|uniref:Uncharacterized protein n=1 Tax=Gynuella sunshinyii YC6258 TaxID=1445510 RepID=A0A0C5VQP3_9GAMM|nr:hypothetical Protein YC6258_00539 [Gynuella sunshinyii YC6258]